MSNIKLTHQMKMPTVISALKPLNSYLEIVRLLKVARSFVVKFGEKNTKNMSGILKSNKRKLLLSVVMPAQHRNLYDMRRELSINTPENQSTTLLKSSRMQGPLS